MWAVCGNWGNYGGPKIAHLANILSNSPQRAQFYANLITGLSFSEEGEKRDFLEEGRFHQQLKTLQFPQLKSAIFHGLEGGWHTGEAMLHYLQPNLESFSVHFGCQMSDRLLEALSQSCPKLRDFDMDDIHNNTVSKEGLVSFLKATDLHSLKLGTSFKNCLTHEAFIAMCECQNLILLSIPEIEDDWISSLPKTTRFHLSTLGCLYTTISDQGMKSLAQYTPELGYLDLNLQDLPPSSHIIASAACCNLLNHLTIKFGQRSSVDSYDLLLLARNCPNLSELVLEYDLMGDFPSTLGVDDNVMDGIAQKWPAIKELTLMLHLPNVTWRSALSFGRHCKKLEKLKLCCNFSWEKVMLHVANNTFPELLDLSITFSQVNSDEQVTNFDHGRFVQMAPKLTNFSISGGSEADEARLEAVKMALYTRQYPDYTPPELGRGRGRGGHRGRGNRGRGRGDRGRGGGRDFLPADSH